MEVSRSISSSSITNLDEEEETIQDSKQSPPSDLHLSDVYKKEQTKHKGDKTSTRMVLYGHSRVLHCGLYRRLNEKHTAYYCGMFPLPG